MEKPIQEKMYFPEIYPGGDEVTEKAYRALNGEYKLYTGDIGDNITSVMMIPAGIIISIFLIYEIFGKSKEKEQEEQ